MIKAVGVVRDAILRERADGCADLQTITRMVVGLTAIDHVAFTRYAVPRTNPIWGSFRRFERRQSPYDSVQTYVEVRYADHLSEPERKFVVCKELCHALDAGNGAHDISDPAILGLVEIFSLHSQKGLADLTPTVAFNSEILAELCAIEIICPLPIRRQLIADAGSSQVDLTAVCEKFCLYSDYASVAFLPDYINWISLRFDQGY